MIFKIKKTSRRGRPPKKTQAVWLNRLTKLNVNDVLVVLGLIVLVLTGSFVFLKPKKPSPTPEPLKPAAIEAFKERLSLPTGWQLIEDKTPGVLAKLEKTSEEKIKPTMTVVSAVTGETDSKAYVDKLLKGARSAIPSLTLISDESKDKDGYYLRQWEGFYFSGSDRINLRQQVLVKDGHVYTLTVAFGKQDQELSQEVDSLFTSAFEGFAK